MGKPGNRWTGEEIQKLKTLAQTRPAASIAAELGRSVSALAVKAHELKLSLRLKRAEMDPPPAPEPGPAGFDLKER